MARTKSVDTQQPFVKDLPDWYAKRMWSVRVATQNNRAKKKMIEGLLTYEGVIQRLSEHDYMCAQCGTDSYICLDHIQPLSKGGLNIDSNIQPLCRMCNLGKNKVSKS